MSTTEQLCKALHPLQVVQSLHAVIPTRTGEAWQGWLSNPTGPPPSFHPGTMDRAHFSDEYLFAELLSKYDALPIDVNRQAVALQGFKAREEVNRDVNNRFRNAYLPTDPVVSRVLRRHRRFMRRVLGSFSQHAEATIAASYFGPGTNVGVRYGKSSLFDKVNVKLTCTREFAPFALSVVNSNDFAARAFVGADGPVTLLDLPLDIREGAKLAFVPKNAKTDRSITVEPLLNSFFQNGLGKVIRLLIHRRTTMDLSKQSRNQVAAQKAYREGYATVDLKDASNSLTIELVRNSLSLCRGWFHVLDIARSQRYTCKSIDQDVHTFELFAGMGNGFTFPLESLIFYSLSLSVMEELEVGGYPVVYGDDIIIPNTCFDLLASVFSSVGLEVNHGKTFRNGAFYESCGKHYHEGLDVTPFYIRSQPKNALWYYTVHNNLWKWACRDGTFFDSRVIPVLEMIRGLQSGTFVHPDLGDVGYFPLKSHLTKMGIGRWTITTERGREFVYKGSKGYWCALHQGLTSIGHDTSPQGRFTRRGGLVKIKRQRILYSDYNFLYIIV